jgi:hypothetical protein
LRQNGSGRESVEAAVVVVVGRTPFPQFVEKRMNSALQRQQTVAF